MNNTLKIKHAFFYRYQPEIMSDPITFSTQLKGFDNDKHPFLGQNNPMDLGQFGMDEMPNYQSTNHQLDTLSYPQWKLSIP